MTDVFLSYTSKDRPFAAKLEAALSQAGFSVFWDQETAPGMDWDEWIRSKLNAAKAVVVLWSKASVASPNVRHEAMIARDAKKLVPVLIEDLKPDDFPMGLYLVQAVPMAHWNGDAADPRFKRIVAELSARMGKPAPELPKGGGARKGGPAPALIAAGVALAAGVGGYVWWSNQPKGALADPQAEAAAAAQVEVGPLDFALGRWDWGQGCADPSVVSEGGAGQLVFATKDTRFVHEIGEVSPGVVSTAVVEPADFAGDVYRIIGGDNSLTIEQVSPNIETNTWTRCP
jgi:hypothetical protein